MSLFSQRYGFRLVKSVIQSDGMDDNLRIGLWNVLYEHYLEPSVIAWNEQAINLDKYNLYLNNFCKPLWSNFLKLPLDKLNNDTRLFSSFLKDKFGTFNWYEIYDLLEFIASFNLLNLAEVFKKSCDDVLEEELSAYRFVGEFISPIISAIEISEIEKAIEKSEPYAGVKTHLNTALKFLSDRKSPDYRNSIKESISAIESIIEQVTNKKDFGHGIEEMEKKIGIHGALRKAFIKLYGYTSDAEGIRHALLEESSLDLEDAMFMLVTCSAFINYLKVKIEKSKNNNKND